MQIHQTLTPLRPLMEIIVIWNSRKLALEVDLVFLAVSGMVQDGVDVVEDVELRDLGFGICILGFGTSPIFRLPISAKLMNARRSELSLREPP